MKFIIIILSILMSKLAFAEFFKDMSGSIKNNQERLSYGVSVTDFNKDGDFEFVVTGFRFPNLILRFRKGKHRIISPIETKDQNESQTKPIMKRILREILFNFLAPIKH